MLKTIQIVALVFVGCLVVEYSVWLAWKPRPVLLATAAAVTSYLSFMWAIFKRSPDGWLQAGFHFVFRLLLSTSRKAFCTLLVCGSAAAYSGVLLYDAWQTEEKQPDYLVQVFRGNPNTPAVGAIVTVNDPLLSRRLEETTDSYGNARFRLAAWRMWQVSITLVQRDLKRVAVLPVDSNINLPSSKDVDLDSIQKESWREFLPDRLSTAEYASAKTETVDEVRSANGEGQLVGASQFLKKHLPWGVLRAPLIICREPYIIGFDPIRHIPRWVAYKINFSDTVYPRLGHEFAPDPLIPIEIQSSSEAYVGNSYDRGQLVYRRDLSGYGQDTQKTAFYMSIMSPQIDRLNQGVWSDIERYANALSETDEIWILAGPAFTPNPGSATITYPVIGGNVAVPTHFFRILIRRNNNSALETIAFLVPNTTDVRGALGDFLTSIDNLESITGLDFFSALSEQERRTLKSTTSSLWPVVPDN